METYLLHTKACDWRIEKSLNGTRWMLKRRSNLPPAIPSDWIPVGLFNSAKQAAEAVATGTTGESAWDSQPRPGKRSDYELPAWVRDHA